ncbi:MAG: methyl-accepting chemotaxis protein [Spirochaetota bacterium]
MRYIVQFRDNESKQAAYTENVSASIDEKLIGINSAADNTDIQNFNLEILHNSIRDLGVIIDGTGKEVTDALETVRQFLEDTQSGNEALSIMENIINKIFESSIQVNGIIQIVNDISDRINLLSYNAAIDPTIPWDSWWELTVVGDEISKLADQTATSMLGIVFFIKTNDNQIKIGAENIKKAKVALYGKTFFVC